LGRGGGEKFSTGLSRPSFKNNRDKNQAKREIELQFSDIGISSPKLKLRRRGVMA
jgi:hypothetical protein